MSAQERFKHQYVHLVVLAINEAN